MKLNKILLLSLVALVSVTNNLYAHHTCEHYYNLKIYNKTDYNIMMEYSNPGSGSGHIMVGWIHADYNGESHESGDFELNGSDQTFQINLHVWGEVHDALNHCSQATSAKPLNSIGKWHLDAYDTEESLTFQIGHLSFYPDRNAHLYIDDIDESFPYVNGAFTSSPQKFRFYMCWNGHFHHENETSIPESHNHPSSDNQVNIIIAPDTGTPPKDLTCPS